MENSAHYPIGIGYSKRLKYRATELDVLVIQVRLFDLLKYSTAIPFRAVFDDVIL